MMHNSFEKQIREKMNQVEVPPGDALLETIFEKRAARSKPAAGFGYARLVMAVAVIAVTAGVWYMVSDKGSSNKGAQIANNGNATENQSVSEKPANSNLATADPSADLLSESEIKTATVVPNGLEKSRSIEPATKLSVSSSVKSSGKGIGSSRIVSRPAKKGSFEIGDPSVYFNVDALGRPSIDMSMHKGNSHVYVFNTVDPDELSNEILRYSSTSLVEKSKVDIENEVLVPAAPEKLNPKNLNKSGNPIFVDLMMNPGMSAFCAFDGEQASVNNSVNKISFNNGYGLRVSVPVAKRINVFSGIGYVNQTNQYKGSLPYEQNVQTINTKVTYINDPIRGVIRVETKDTVNTVNKLSQNVDFKNTYSVVRVPIGMAYNFGLGNTDFAFNASMDFNMVSNANGFNINTETHGIEAFRSNARSFGIGYGLSFMAAKKISPRFRILLEPGFYHYSINGSAFGNKVSERINNYNLTVGLRYTVF